MMRFLAYIPVYLIGWIMVWPLVPLAVMFSNADGRLPWVFRWLETHDALGWIGPATEHATISTTQRWGQKAGLVHYLWRNKAYTLRYWMRARITDDMPRNQSGVSVPDRWGFSYWRGHVGTYWEYQPRFGFGKFHLYLRLGWKMKPFFDAGPYGASAGIFTGISVRSDDWDDFPQQKEN